MPVTSLAVFQYQNCEVEGSVVVVGGNFKEVRNQYVLQFLEI
jgi:hypothetical protein